MKTLEYGDLKLSFQPLDKVRDIYDNLDSDLYQINTHEEDQRKVAEEGEFSRTQKVMTNEERERLFFSDPAKWESIISAENQEAPHIGTKQTL